MEARLRKNANSANTRKLKKKTEPNRSKVVVKVYRWDTELGEKKNTGIDVKERGVLHCAEPVVAQVTQGGWEERRTLLTPR